MFFYQKICSFYIIIILISFICQSNGNDQKKFERIENTIKLILSSIKGIINRDPFSFKCRKYSIEFNNFKLLSPIQKNIKLNKESENFFIIKDIYINFIIDLDIQLFSDQNNIIKEKSVFIECLFSEIKFKIIDDYNIEFISFSLDTVNLSPHNKIAELNFFDDFNKNNNCTFIDGDKTVIIEDKNIKLKEIFVQMFEEKIRFINKNINLLTYDMIYLLNNCTKIFENDYYDYISSFQVTKIATNSSFINFDRNQNRITISNLVISGYYSLMDYFNISYSFICGVNKNHFIYEKKHEKIYFDIILDDCKLMNEKDREPQIYFEEEDEEISKGITNNFKEQLNKNADYYYNTFLEIQ
jgi:hypothetical protein